MLIECSCLVFGDLVMVKIYPRSRRDSEFTPNPPPPPTPPNVNVSPDKLLLKTSKNNLDKSSSILEKVVTIVTLTPPPVYGVMGETQITASRAMYNKEKAQLTLFCL